MGPTTAEFRLEGPPIPADAVVESYQASEAISRLFEVEVEFYTMDATFDAETCVSQALLLKVLDDTGESRFFHGVVDRAEFTRWARDRFYFRVRMVPALAALAHREDCRIFQDQGIIDVIKTIFTEAGFITDVTWKISNTYLPREYIVQYRESTLNFVSRLMEDEGIFYYFQHSASGHTMTIADKEDAFGLEAGTPGVTFAMGQGMAAGGDSLERFTRTRTLRTTQVVLRDYDFEKPQTKPVATQSKSDGWPMFYFEYPGGFTKTADGTRRATARMRELRAEVDVCRGESHAVGLRVGAPCGVEAVAEGCLSGQFVVTSLNSRGHQMAEADHSHDADAHACHNEFTAIPAGSPFAPPRLASKPRIRGVQTVLVTGPSASQDQTIHCDNYGRIKVHFFWDRVGQLDDKCSCWLRTNQAMMGGTMVLPRVGWELSVGFFDGDPNRPFAIGRLYNAEKPPPYGLPGAQASGSVKSLSAPGGAGHNEMKMSDSGGSQGHGMTAQKDLNSTIGNNKSEKIAVDDTHSVTSSMNSSIGSNESLTVSGNQAVDIGAVLSEKVGGNQAITVSGADTTNADSNLVEHVTGNRAYTVSGMGFTMQNGIEHTITGNLKRDVSIAQLNGSVASITDNIIGNLDETATLAKIILAKGNVGETITGNKKQIAAAAEVHLIKGSYQASCDAAVTRLIGALHQWKVAGDISLKGDKVTLLGATGTFVGGSSSIKLGGGPAVLTGSTITVEAPMIIKIGGTLKIGPG